MDFYMSVIVEVAYNMAKSYIQQGWKIDKMECRDFQFHSDITTSWID